MILDGRNFENYTSKLYKQSLVPADSIGKLIIDICVYMLYIHIFSTAFFFFLFVSSIKMDWLKHEKNVVPHAQLRVFVLFSLCISEWYKNQSLCFCRKSNIPWKARRTEGLCLQRGNRSSRLVFCTLFRLASAWALHTLK